MKFINNKKYSVLSKIFKISFVGIFSILVILPFYFIKIEAATNPIISNFSPSSGNIGDMVVINGSNFENTNNVVFNLAGTTNFTLYGNNKIIVNVPVGATSGKIKIQSSLGEEAVSSTNFTIAPNAPVAEITSFSPTEGKAGDDVTISGLNFSGITQVLFNTTPTVTATSNSTEIVAKVPVGASTGKIILKNVYGDTISSSMNFKINSPAPGACVNGGLDYPTCTPPAGGGVGSPTPPRVIVWHGLVPECNTGAIKDGTYVNACDFDMVMAIINKVINYLLVILATPLFALIIIYVGWLYLSDMGSSENITHAKKILKNAVIGYVIALAAWLIVKTILTSLGFTGETYLTLLLINYI